MGEAISQYLRKVIQEEAQKLVIPKKSVGPLVDDSRIYRSLSSILNSSDNMEVTDPYQKSVWVFAAINAIAQNISRVPFYVYEEKKKDIKTPVFEGALYDLFVNPNPFMITSSLMFATVLFMELYGEAFWILEGRKNITEIPTEIWCVTPTRFEPLFDKNRQFKGYWEYTARDMKVTFAPHEILQFKYFNPYNDIRGLSGVEASRLGVEQDYFASKYNKQFFKDGVSLSGIVEAPDFLTDEQYNRLKIQFEERHSGYGNAHKVGIVEGGAEFKETKAMSQRDMEFSVLKTVIRGEILAAFKTNEVVLGNYENIQCFHPDTEVMTDNGFVSVTDIKVGDKIASMNPETGLIEFKDTAKIYTYDYDGEMYTQKKSLVNGQNIALKTDYMITPEHKMFGKEKDCKHNKFKSDYKFKRIAEIQENTFGSPKNGEWDGELIDEFIIEKKEDSEKLSKKGSNTTTFPIVPWLKFLGWFISEGCYRRASSYELGIAQANEEGLTKLREDLKDFPYTFKEYQSKDWHGSTFVTSGKDLYNYLIENVGHYCHEKRIPRDILNLHPSLLEYLFYSLIEGDGTKTKNDSFVFYTTSKGLANDVYELALRVGRVPTLKGGNEGLVRKSEKYPNKKNMWQVYISNKEQNNKLVTIRPEKVEYKGKVYCFEVPPYHNVLTRYNGKSLMISQSYEGIANAHQSFWKETLLPKIIYLEDFLWAKFFSKILAGKYWGSFDISVIEALREDFRSKVDMAEILNKMGYPINMINKRLDMGFEDVKWGNTWFVRMGMVPVEYAMENPVPEPAKPSGDDDDEPGSKPTKPAEGEDEEEPMEPDEGEKKLDLTKRDDSLWGNFLAREVPVEQMFKSKLKRFLYEQRKRVLVNVYKNEENPLIIDDEIKLLEKVFANLYYVASQTGKELLKEELLIDEIEYKELDDFIMERLKFSSKTVINTIYNSLLKVLTESTGKSSKVQADKIRTLYNKTDNRIATIARTETSAIINGIRFLLMQKNGVKYHKWLSRAESGRHAKFNNKIVKLGESFSKDFTLRYPTDKKAPVQEVVGCLCYCIPVVKLA
ncbi:MAG: phage portal protein [Candidatus Babeliales bacterium]